MFAQPFVQAQIKDNWPLWGESNDDQWIPLTKGTNAENGSIWWHHHDSFSIYHMNKLSSKINNICHNVWVIFVTMVYGIVIFNILRPRKNGHHFSDDIFKCIFLNENVWILIKISLQFVPKGPVNNIPALVQIMAWHQLDDKPLSEPMVVRLSRNICIIQHQWINGLNLFKRKMSISTSFFDSLIISITNIQPSYILKVISYQ